ncbi:MAG: family 16 glycoside hydrolase [Fibrobacteria bacterium]
MRVLICSVFLVLTGAASGQPTTATKTDSGWVPLFNGTDFSGLYDYVSNSGTVDVKTQTNFTVEPGGIIHVKGNPGGYLGTIRQYSHYRVRVDYQWPVGTAGDANSGLLIHLDSAAIFSGFKSAGRPRSIEVNCRRDTDFPWSLWSANGLGPFITTKVTAVPGSGKAGQYNPAGVEWTDNPYGTSNSRVITGDFQRNPELPLGQWNHGEAHLYGDSGVFTLNGQVRTWGRNFSLGSSGSSPASRVACTRGNIGLQSEGYPISFRNYEIMELDSITYAPINARKGCTTQSSGNYDPRAVVDNGTCSGTALMRREGGRLRFLSNDRFGTWLAFPEGSSRVQLFDLSGHSLGTYRGESGGLRLPASAPRGVLAARFLP